MTKPSITLTARSVTTVISIICLVAIGSVLWIGWQKLQVTPEKISQMRPEPAAKPAIAPILKLNTTHQRQGEIIQVDPETIGKPNPFQ